jgi:predicted Zn-dependent protease
VRNPMTARDIYLSKLDGLLYGGDPEEGFIRGQDFLHPKLRFAFSVPEGFNLINSNKAVYAFGPNKSRIIFDRASKPADGPMEYYLSRIWGAKMSLNGLETIRVNGLEAATATTQIRTNEGTFDARLTAYRVDTQTIYRMIFLTAGADTNRLATGLRRTTYSFRTLSPAEAARLRPLVLRIVTVRPGDIVESLASRLPYSDYKVERFEVLNGISRNDRLVPGQKLKTVTTD